MSKAILALSADPRPPGTKKLRSAPQWRIRVGPYRVLYAVFDKDRTVIIDRVARRTTTTYD